MIAPARIKVRKSFIGVLMAISYPLTPTWDVQAGDVTLATFISWRDALSFAFKVADRVAARQLQSAASR